MRQMRWVTQKEKYGNGNKCIVVGLGLKNKSKTLKPSD
jgi:hypothetical protein